MENEKRLLLISNSTEHGRGYLDHCEDAILAFLNEVKRVLFVPYALKDTDSYTEKARERFAKMGIEISSIYDHESRSHTDAVKGANAIFIGGGNTFRLLKTMYLHFILPSIQYRVKSGDLLYMGASAGANVACPTICTTNDMPIVRVHTFDALGLVPFQINPHFVDADSNSCHMGETRETRIKEFHEEDSTPVVGLREGSWLEVTGKRVMLRGGGGAKIFLRGEESRDVLNGGELGHLLQR